MQTIKTKYLGPTDTRGARIKATASGGESTTISYPYDQCSAINIHSCAVGVLCLKLGWKDCEFFAVDNEGGNGFIFALSTEKVHIVNGEVVKP